MVWSRIHRIRYNQELLKSCPANRVFIVENECKSLDSDSFILSLCDAMNGEENGIISYRKSIVEHASKQHDFVFRQLEEYPTHNPTIAIEEISKCRDLLKQDIVDKETVRTIVNNAKKKISHNDISEDVRGKVYLEAGIVSLLLGDIDAAEESLNTALPFWSQDRNKFKQEVVLEKANTLRALGETYLAKNDLKKSEGCCRRAAYRYSQISNKVIKDDNLNNENYEENMSENYAIQEEESKNYTLQGEQGEGYTAILLSDIFVRLGRIDSAHNQSIKAKGIFNNIGDKYGVATSNKSMAVTAILRGDRQLAEDMCEEARSIYSDLRADHDIARSEILLSRIKLGGGDFDRAKQLADSAHRFFCRVNDQLGIVSSESMLGDLFEYNNKLAEAFSCYQRAAEICREIKANHDLMNALASQIKILQKSQNKSSYGWQIDIESYESKIKGEIELLQSSYNNDYANAILSDDSSGAASP